MLTNLHAWAVLIAVGTVASSAGAHEPPHGRALLWTSTAAEATPAIIVANRGLVFADRAADATTFSLRCYEAYGGGTTEPPGVFPQAQGSLTIGVFSAVKSTSDRACSLLPSDGLPTSVESLGVVVQDTAMPNRLFVSSRTLALRATLYVSEDYGLTWSERFQNPMDDYFHALIPAPSDASRLYAAGRRADRVNQKLIYFSAVSVDGGSNWTDHVLPAEIIPFAVHPSNPDIVFAYEPTNVLETEFRVLRSADRGALYKPVLEGVPMPTALAAGRERSTLWLGIGGDGGLYRSSDDGQHFEPVRADSVQSVTCLAYRQGRLWLCANLAPNTDGIWFSDDAGGTLEKWMEFADVRQPVMCAQADAGAVCDLAWHDFDVELHPRLPDAGVDIDAGAVGLDASMGSEADAAHAPIHPVDASPPNPDTSTVSPAAGKRRSGCQALAAQAPAAAPLWYAWLALSVLAARWSRRRS